MSQTTHPIVEAGKATRFQKGKPPGPGRPKKPTITEALRAEVEKQAAELAAGYLSALRAAAESGDSDKIIRALEAIADRVDGRPTQRTEMAGGLTLENLIGNAGDVVE